jgi:hypothetical protein
VDGVPCGKAFLTKRVRSLSFSCGSVGVFFCPAGSEPRRSGCASGAALRPALACDRAGTARRADPRCSPPLHEALGRGQRLHPPVWPLGARTLRRDGSMRPRGGSPRRPPVCNAPTRPVSPYRQGGHTWSSHRTSGGGLSICRCRGWQIFPKPAGTGRTSRVGETAAQHHANAEGPRCGSRPPVAGKGVWGRSGWGDARPHPATHGAGTTKLSRSGRKGACRAPARRIEYPHPPFTSFACGQRAAAGLASWVRAAPGGSL